MPERRPEEEFERPLVEIDWDKGETDDRKALRRLGAEEEEDELDGESFSMAAEEGKALRKAGPALVCYWITLIEVENWVETKAVWVTRCWKVGPVKFCIKVPRIYHRKCTVRYLLQVCHPDLRRIIREVVACIRAALNSVIPLFLAGQVKLAFYILKIRVLACLREKGIEQLDDFVFGIRKVTSCSQWNAL